MQMSGFPVHHQLPELAQTHVHWVGDAIQTSHSVIPFSFCLQSFPASGSLLMSQFFISGGQSIGVSASASVLPMNIQDWSPLGWTGWISLQSKGLPRVFSNTTVQKHQFFGTQSNSHIHTRLLGKTIALTKWTFVANLRTIINIFPSSSGGKTPTCNAGDLGLIPQSGRYPGEGNGNPFQYSCLENPHGQRILAA